MSANGIRVLPAPGEQPPPGDEPWWEMKDELTGDAVPLHGMAVEMAERGLQSLPVASGHLNFSFLKSGPTPGGHPPAILFLGSPYANKFLARMLDDERASYPFGAWFDVASPVKRRTARVEFHWQNGAEKIWDLQLKAHPEEEYVVVRRWRTKYGNDAMMFAGTIAQGTAAATDFMRNSDCVRKLVNALKVKDSDWEWTQFDAVLRVPIQNDELYDIDDIDVAAADYIDVPAAEVRPLPATRTGRP